MTICHQAASFPAGKSSWKELSKARAAGLWLLAQKLLEALNRRNHPKPQIFPENPALPRNLPGIPTEFISSAMQNPTEFH